MSPAEIKRQLAQSFAEYRQNIQRIKQIEREQIAHRALRNKLRQMLLENSDTHNYRR